MAEHVSAWQCIGCGSIEAPQTCIGVCEHRKVKFVYAAEHEQALAEVKRRSDTLEAFARTIAHTTPRNGEWERSYRALQEQARHLLGTMSATHTNATEASRP